MPPLHPFIKRPVPDLRYLLKCLLGVIICCLLYIKIPKYPFYSAIVSVVIALSPDNSNRQAYLRMQANLLGCSIGSALKITGALRSAMAADQTLETTCIASLTPSIP